MSTMTLYEIGNAREILESWLIESEGELTPEIEALLAEVEADANTKIERVALYIREQKALALAAKDELARVAAVVARRTRAADSLTLYLHREMDRLGKDKVNGLLATIAIQKNPPSVKGELSADVLEAAYDAGIAGTCPQVVKHVPASFVLDRRAVLDLYKAGQSIPNGLTVEQTSSVRIR